MYTNILRILSVIESTDGLRNINENSKILLEKKKKNTTWQIVVKTFFICMVIFYSTLYTRSHKEKPRILSDNRIIFVKKMCFLFIMKCFRFPHNSVRFIHAEDDGQFFIDLTMLCVCLHVFFFSSLPVTTFSTRLDLFYCTT